MRYSIKAFTNNRKCYIFMFLGIITLSICAFNYFNVPDCRKSAKNCNYSTKYRGTWGKIKNISEGFQIFIKMKPISSELVLNVTNIGNRSQQSVDNLVDLSNLSKPLINITKTDGDRQSVENVDDSSSLSISMPTSIIILAGGRTGSSFTGKILASHPNSLYFYEPLHPINKYLHSHSTSAKINMLRSILECNFWPKDRVTRVNSTLQKESCKAQNVLIKTIRIENVGLLKGFVDQMGTKIVHLVRDPRAVYWSRKKIRWTPDISSYCYQMLSSFKTGSGWKNDKYFLLKYEDLALNPVEVSQKLLKFVGLTMDSNVLKFIRENTLSENQTDLKKPLSLKRNSKNHISAWKKALSGNIIADITRRCKGLMDALNYR